MHFSWKVTMIPFLDPGEPTLGVLARHNKNLWIHWKQSASGILCQVFRFETRLVKGTNRQGSYYVTGIVENYTCINVALEDLLSSGFSWKNFESTHSDIVVFIQKSFLSLWIGKRRILWVNARVEGLLQAESGWSASCTGF